jgi:cytochrome c1
MVILIGKKENNKETKHLRYLVIIKFVLLFILKILCKNSIISED